MSKKRKIYIGLLIFTILSLVYLEMNKPKEVNWYKSYATHHQIPFGSYVFNKQLKRIATTVIPVDRPPFEYLKNNTINGTYLFYNNSVNFGETELNLLLNWTSKGNTLVVSSLNFEERLLDTLHLEMESVNTFNNFSNKYQLQQVNPNLDKTKYKFDRASTLFHFSKIDTLNTKIIGLVDKLRSDTDSVSNPLINVIKQPFGKGNIILNAFPQAFTNYFILNTPNQNYTAGLISYLDKNQPIYLDKHYKSGKKFYTSPMYLFLNNPYLKWAYYMVLIGVLFYIIFEGKRKQRAILIVKPLKNQTVDFTRTISDMYYNDGKHSKIVEHKILHFLEYIRNNMYISTSEINPEFIKNLAARSNNTLDDTQHLFNYINELQKINKINSLQLEKLNRLIEKFKSHNQWKTKN